MTSGIDMNEKIELIFPSDLKDFHSLGQEINLL